ncbi:MAG: T9SS type A sorting domain-containing protein [Candidatus Cloacimonetes bacterium]|nr:T9SS type A sorting domain-containing protein [Candidatus Cloacimonadota bacterium]
MLKHILMLLSVILVFSLSAIHQDIIQTSQSSVNIQISTNREEINEETISHTVALLAEDAHIEINSMQIATYNSNGDLIERDSVIDSDRVRLINQFTMREMYGFTSAVELVKEESNFKSVIEELNYNIVGTGNRTIPEEISEAFYPVYKSLALNFDSSYLVNLPFKQPAMMIISHDSAQITNTLEPFIRWKRATGMEITVVNRTDIGANPTNNMIRNYVINYYQTTDNKPEYLLLIGGARTGASLPIPTFYTGAANNANDLPYGLIEGDDYFPEVMVGRFSVNNSYQLATIVNKTVAYEKEPFMDETEWMERAIVIAGNYASTLPIPITPVLMSKWLVELLYESGYTEVDTVFWYPGSSSLTQPVIDAVNRSGQYINYRGWGDANGWHYPLFHINHLANTNAGRKSPVVSSFVCNTGDFINSNVNPCFGEYWMTMGTPTTPNGAVGFVGPSDLHTSTEYNNAIASGYHWGIQREGIRSFGAAILRGKMEIYNGYPNNLDPGDWVDFYFRVYNTLADPSLNLWKLIPYHMNLTLPTQIDQGTNYLEFDAPNLTGGYVTITRDEENFITHRIENDYAFIPLNPDEEGDIILTVTAKNYLPTIQTIEITSSNNITLLEYDFAGTAIYPGETITLNTTLKNYSNNNVADVSATLSSNFEDFITITEETVNYGDISAGGTASGSFEFEIAGNCPHHTVLQFTLNISPTGDVAKLQVLVVGIHIEVDGFVINSPNSILDPGETATIDVTISNHGISDLLNLSTVIEPYTDAVYISEDMVNIGDISAGESSTFSFEVVVHDDTYVGREAYFKLNFFDADGRFTYAFINTTIGEVTNTAPTGPCYYGYYAFDSYDTDYSQAPLYNWVDIDPDNGGPGTAVWLPDDGTMTMDMPFTFRYYGIDYNEISICSNGWITFIPTEEINFRNWPIPSAIVPKGIIAPYWDDLKGLDEVDNELRVAYYHDEINNRMIISWLDAYSVANLTPSGLEKIQVILEPKADDDGDIIFQYHTVWNQNHTRNYSTTGIMNHTRFVGLQYAYANHYPLSATPIQAGLAIRFTTSAPDEYYSTDDLINPNLGLTLFQNYPNPFNPETVIEFSLPNRSFVTLDVYNILGQKVKTLVDRELDFGLHRFVWNGTDHSGKSVGSGVYLYRLSTPDETEVRRMILIK